MNRRGPHEPGSKIVLPRSSALLDVARGTISGGLIALLPKRCPRREPMKKSLRVDAEAEEEIAHAIDRHENEREGLGLEFGPS